MTHHDGTLTTRLVVDEVTREAEGDGEHVVVALRDELVDLTVELHARTHPRSAVLEQWIEIVHAQPGPVPRTCQSRATSSQTAAVVGAAGAHSSPSCASSDPDRVPSSTRSSRRRSVRCTR